MRDMVDITGADIVEVRVRNDGTVLWVNVDGTCILRVCRTKKIEVIDERVREDGSDLPHAD